jgi:hypothetical protein
MPALVDLFTLTPDQVRFLLDLIREKYGGGYAEGDVGKLQVKLSMILEAGVREGPVLPPDFDRARFEAVRRLGRTGKRG